jgi:hypothetical protein
MSKKAYYYDIESFPNYFCITFLPTDLSNDNVTKFIKDDMRIYNESEDRSLYESDIELWTSIKDNLNPVIFECLDNNSYNLENLVTFLERDVNILIGYNNSSYDDIILDLIYIYIKDRRGVDAKLINSWSHKIIANQEYGNPRYSFGELSGVGAIYLSMDLMKLHYLDKNYISLKQTSIVLKWYKIQDYIIPEITYEDFIKVYSYNLPAGKEDEFYQRYVHLPSFYKYVLPEFIPGIQLYNINDVLITRKLHQESTKELKTRYFATTKYGIPLHKTINASRSKLSDLLLVRFYEDFSSLGYNQFKDKRTERGRVTVGECIVEDVVFTGSVPIRVYSVFKKTPGSKPEYKLIPTIKNLVDFKNMMSLLQISTTNQVEYVITINNTDYTIASGGLHSKDKPLVVQSTDKISYIDADVSSYYPSMVVNYHIKPQHLTDAFVKIAKMVTEERLEAKKLKKTDPEMAGKAEVLKIVANVGFFGKFGSDSWLKDMKALVTVTFTGQLLLLMLVEMLEDHGFPVISANTDGIISRIPIEKKKEYDNICLAWEAKTKLSLEFTEIDTYIRRDVNHYSLKTKDGEFKYKGAEFNSELDLLKGYRHPIVPIAVEKYFFEGIPIKDTIYNHKDILDFCISQKIGKQFIPEFHYVKGSAEQIDILQHNIRYYVSNSGGVLMKKYKDKNNTVSLVKDRLCKVLNMLYEAEDIKDYDIDYQFYIAEADKTFQSVYGQLKLGTLASKVKTGYLFDNL